MRWQDLKRPEGGCLTIVEVSQELHVSDRAIQARISKGSIEAVKIDKRWWIHISEVHRIRAERIAKALARVKAVALTATGTLARPGLAGAPWTRVGAGRTSGTGGPPTPHQIQKMKGLYFEGCSVAQISLMLRLEIADVRMALRGIGWPALFA